jgi:HD superfamily phosphodiesterase
MKTEKKLKKIKDEIFTSPDGGETVYAQRKDGSRGRMVSQTQYAKDMDTLRDEEEMVDEYAVKMRRKYPALGKAWKHYKTVWHLIMGNK